MALKFVRFLDGTGKLKRLVFHAEAGSLPEASITEDLQAAHAILAGEQHIGQVGGTISVVTVSANPADSAYAPGDAVGGKLTFANAARIPAGSGKVTGAVLTDSSGQRLAADLLLFDADPSASTWSDGSGASLAAADAGKYIGALRLDTPVTIGVVSINQADGSVPFKLPAGQTLYGALVFRESQLPPPDYSGGATLTVRIFVEQN